MITILNLLTCVYMYTLAQGLMVTCQLLNTGQSLFKPLQMLVCKYLKLAQVTGIINFYLAGK